MLVRLCLHVHLRLIVRLCLVCVCHLRLCLPLCVCLCVSVSVCGCGCGCLCGLSARVWLAICVCVYLYVCVWLFLGFWLWVSLLLLALATPSTSGLGNLCVLDCLTDTWTVSAVTLTVRLRLTMRQCLPMCLYLHVNLRLTASTPGVCLSSASVSAYVRVCGVRASAFGSASGYGYPSCCWPWLPLHIWPWLPLHIWLWRCLYLRRILSGPGSATSFAPAWYLHLHLRCVRFRCSACVLLSGRTRMCVQYVCVCAGTGVRVAGVVCLCSVACTRVYVCAHDRKKLLKPNVCPRTSQQLYAN